MVDFSSDDLFPCVPYKKATIFDHYVIIHPISKMDDFFGATLNFLEPLCSNVKWCLQFIPMMDFSSDGLSPSVGNKKANIYDPISSYNQYQKWMIFWTHPVYMPNGVCLSYQ
jgi:hypothetical protein